MLEPLLTRTKELLLQIVIYFRVKKYISHDLQDNQQKHDS